MFGPTRRVSLRLLDIPMALEALDGVKMELQDGAFSLVDEITPTSDLEVAFKDADVAILVGGFPRKQGMQRFVLNSPGLLSLYCIHWLELYSSLCYVLYYTLART